MPFFNCVKTKAHVSGAPADCPDTIHALYGNDMPEDINYLCC